MKITKADHAEYVELKTYDRIKVGASKPKENRKGGKRRQPKWIELVATEDDLDAAEETTVEAGDWRHYSVSQSDGISDGYPVFVEPLKINGKTTYLIVAIAERGAKIVLESYVNKTYAEGFAAYLSTMNKEEQLISAKRFSKDNEWWDDDVTDIRAAGYEVL